MKFRKLALAGAVVSAISIAAHAAGVFPGFTPFGSTSPSYQSWTGLETGPLDTNQAGGVAPQTVLASALQLGLPVSTISTSASTPQTIPNGVTVYGLDTGTPATLVLNMPTAPVAGQVVTVSCLATVAATAFTIQANAGQTIKGGLSAAATSCASGAAYRYFFNAATSQWIRF